MKNLISGTNFSFEELDSFLNDAERFNECSEPCKLFVDHAHVYDRSQILEAISYAHSVGSESIACAFMDNGEVEDIDCLLWFDEEFTNGLWDMA